VRLEKKKAYVLGDDRAPLTPAVAREAWRVAAVAAWIAAGLCAMGIVGIHFLMGRV